MTASKYSRIISIFIALVLTASAGGAFAEDTAGPKGKALEAFRNADYQGALDMMMQAREEDPSDAEIPYYLGYFHHYLCYDSVPLSGFSRKDSDLVLEYLGDALDMDPGLGNARYFVGAEYGVRARDALAMGDTLAAKEELALGTSGGGYPPWMLEYARKMLESCDRDAILITGGDAETNPVIYLQLVDGFRRDVTAMPEALLERPWYVRFMKKGIPGVVAPAPISWTDWQISNMHPYKWKTNAVEVTVDANTAARYKLEKPLFSWELPPDLGESRLSPSGALTADIVKTNRFARPVHFSLGCAESMFHGLKGSFQLCGLTYRLLPVSPKEEKAAIDRDSVLRVLGGEGALVSVATWRECPMERASSLLHNYRAVFLSLVRDRIEAGDMEKAAEMFSMMESAVPAELIPYGPLEGYVSSLRSLIYR